MGAPGQAELYEDIAQSVQAQLAGESATRVFHVEAGHGVGKTFGCAGIVNWFFDCFVPAVIITTAPTSDQVELLLWKDIKSQRKKAKEKLPGRVLPGTPRMERGPDHFAIGRTTSDSGGQGTSRAQGQHAPFMLFVLDEAEGVPAFYFDAVNAMMSGGQVLICLMIGNPKTRDSEFYRWGKKSWVRRYRFSLHDFPNVLDGADTVPGGTSRAWVERMIGEHCEVVPAHDEAELTFQMPFPVALGDGTLYPEGTIFRPDAEYQFRVMGIAPATDALRSFIATGTYEAARNRQVEEQDSDVLECRIGVDVARFGMDAGTVYVRHRARLWRHARLHRVETDDYVEAIRGAALAAVQEGARSVHVRLDGTGGFAAGLVDKLRVDSTLNLLPDFRVLEVHFSRVATDPDAFADIITQCYRETAETLKGVRLVSPPSDLESDLTDRLFVYVNRHGKTVKQLEPKETFRKRHEDRSPDDGDGCALAAAPDFVFHAMALSSRPLTHRIVVEDEAPLPAPLPRPDHQGRFIPPPRTPARPIF